MANEPDPMLTGAAFELANAGFTPMPDVEERDDQEAIGGDSVSLREAAAQRTGPQGDVTIREYLDDSGKPAAANEAITLARAGRDYANATAADQLLAEGETSKTLAARVDALRAEALARDPDAAEFYGFDPPKPQDDEIKSKKTESEESADKPSDTGRDRDPANLAPDLEKALQHPQVRQAIEERIGEVEKSRQSYLSGLGAATQIAQVSFLSQFPELANLAPQDLPAALEQLSRQNPEGFARVQAMVATTEHLFAQQREESHRQTDVARQRFQHYAHGEDARFDTLLSGESRQTQAAVASEILASAKASGVETGELMRLFNSEPLMRNAVFQHMMYDAGKYRLMMKAKDTAVAKPVPPVQRPGMARTPAEREHADLRTLSARLASSGDIKDAVALYNAKKSSRR